MKTTFIEINFMIAVAQSFKKYLRVSSRWPIDSLTGGYDFYFPVKMIAFKTICVC